MKYINAADVLPEELLKEIQGYVKGDLLYVPHGNRQKRWGEKSGSRTYYLQRNNDMKRKYKAGKSISQISEAYGLAFDTVRRIIYS
ncbi:Mor family transcriptional regulator [Anaerotaenia torta]|uniref:CD3324 family protein n=1 Tax=Anaerotaenia torta TaxID=433293 RepID=UPI003D2399DD